MAATDGRLCGQKSLCRRAKYGDYANLRRTDIQSDDLKLVARALLPAEINVGTKLKYEMFQYEVI